MEQITIPLSDYQGLLFRVQSLETEVSVLLLKNQELTAHNQDLKYQVINLERELYNKTDLVEKLSEQNRIFEDKLANLENSFFSKIKSLEEEVATLGAQKNALEDKVLSLNNRLYGKKKDKINDNKNAANSNRPNIENQIENKKSPGRKATSAAFVPDETMRYDFENAPKCECCK